jgi:hypothetical protein
MLPPKSVTMNYYSGRAVKVRFIETIRGNEIELTRERAGASEEGAANGKNTTQKFVIKRFT